MARGVLRHADGVDEQALDDEVLLLAPGRREVVHLDPVGASLWWELRTAAPLAVAVEPLAGAWGVSPERLVADLSPVVDGLLTAGLLLEQDVDEPRA